MGWRHIPRHKGRVYAKKPRMLKTEKSRKQIPGPKERITVEHVEDMKQQILGYERGRDKPKESTEQQAEEDILQSATPSSSDMTAMVEETLPDNKQQLAIASKQNSRDALREQELAYEMKTLTVKSFEGTKYSLAAYLHACLKERIKSMKDGALYLDGIDFGPIFELSLKQKKDIQRRAADKNIRTIWFENLLGVVNSGTAKELLSLFVQVKDYEPRSKNVFIVYELLGVKASKETEFWWRESFYSQYLDNTEKDCYIAPKVWLHYSEASDIPGSAACRCILTLKGSEGPKSLQEADHFVGKFAQRRLAIISTFPTLHHAAAKKQLADQPERLIRLPLAAVWYNHCARFGYANYILAWSDRIVFEKYTKPSVSEIIVEWEHLMNDSCETLLRRLNLSIFLLNFKKGRANSEAKFVENEIFCWSAILTKEKVRMVIHEQDWVQPQHTVRAGECKVIIEEPGVVRLNCSYDGSAHVAQN